MRLSSVEVDEVVRSVMDLTLRLQTQELQAGPMVDGQPVMVRAEILFKGEWKGQVLLQVDPSLARDMAAVMMMKDPQDTAEAEAMDAVGELANMIAGNLRPLLHGYKGMSLPSVTQAEKRSLPQAGLPLELNYQLDGKGICLAVAEARSNN